MKEAPALAPPLHPPLTVSPSLLEDPSLRVILLPDVARVSVDTPEGGRLNLQIKVNDGVAEVRASGPAAPLFEQHTPELRAALAGEGLSLGQFDLSHSESHRQAERPEPHAPTKRQAQAPLAGDTPTTSGSAGHVHVKA